MKISEGVKNLMFSYNSNLSEIKQLDIVMHLGKALIEANLDQLADVVEENSILHPKWQEAYENRKETEVEIGPYRGESIL